jgi:hypothetical protein
MVLKCIAHGAAIGPRAYQKDGGLLATSLSPAPG